MFRQLEDDVELANTGDQGSPLSSLLDLTLPAMSQAEIDAMFKDLDSRLASDFSQSNSSESSSSNNSCNNSCNSNDALEYLQRAHPDIQEFEFNRMIEEMWGSIDSLQKPLPDLIETYKINDISTILCALTPSAHVDLQSDGILLQEKLTLCHLDADISTEIFSFTINNAKYFFIWLNHSASQKSLYEIATLWQANGALSQSALQTMELPVLPSLTSNVDNIVATSLLQVPIALPALLMPEQPPLPTASTPALYLTTPTASSPAATSSTTLFVHQYLSNSAFKNTPPQYVPHMASPAMILALTELVNYANRSSHEMQYRTWQNVSSYLYGPKPLIISDLTFAAEKALKWKKENVFLTIWSDELIQKSWINSMLPNADDMFSTLFKRSTQENCNMAAQAIIKLYVLSPRHSTAVAFEMFKNAIFSRQYNLACTTWNLIPSTEKFNQITAFSYFLKSNNETRLFDYISKQYQKNIVSFNPSLIPASSQMSTHTHSANLMSSDALQTPENPTEKPDTTFDESKKRRLR
jgi:hypothetical protein